MKDKVRLYQAGDLDQIDPHNGHDGDSTLKARAEAAVRNMVAYTILSPDSSPMAVCGGGLLFTKVAEVWAVVDKKVVKHPKYFCQIIKFLVDTNFEAFELNRMQMVVHSNVPWALRWPSIIGFRHEGVLGNYGEDNKNYYLFSKVRK